jgi:cytochrome c oxidase cbb3-type subunit 2
LNGYNAREEYGEMPNIGTTNKLTAAEISAIINHERTSWGNNARKVPVEEVEKIMEFIKSEKVNQ